MKVVRLATIEELIKNFCSLPNNYIFRGHADASWLLESTLERLIGAGWSKDIAERFESFSLLRFQSKYHLYDQENIEPESKLAWLSLMQHYGVPTRLLDFTESPFVALYFAIEAYDNRVGKDIAIISLDYSELMERSVQYIRCRDKAFVETRKTIAFKQDVVFTNIVDRLSYDIAWVTEPRQVNVRLDRQSGSFLLSGNQGIKICDILDGRVYQGCDFTQYVVPGELYKQLYALLKKMNINSKNIYGDLQGLARSLKMEMTIYAV